MRGKPYKTITFGFSMRGYERLLMAMEREGVVEPVELLGKALENYEMHLEMSRRGFR